MRVIHSSVEGRLIVIEDGKTPFVIEAARQFYRAVDCHEGFPEFAFIVEQQRGSPVPVLLGFGVAIRIRPPELERLWAALSRAMVAELSEQDSQGWRPHVTILNKVSVEAAESLYRMLEASLEPRNGAVTGFLVWEYLGGPWQMARRLSFA